MNSVVVVRRLRLLAVIAVVAHVFGSPAVASAGITPDQCDATPKYYCTHVNYEGDGYYIRYADRWFEGAIGAGGGNTVASFEHYWTQDYWSNNGGANWYYVRGWGEWGWWNYPYLNHPGGYWKNLCCGDINQIALVVMRLRFYDTSSGGYYSGVLVS